jgi:hypothetical protein
MDKHYCNEQPTVLGQPNSSRKPESWDHVMRREKARAHSSDLRSGIRTQQHPWTGHRALRVIQRIVYLSTIQIKFQTYFLFSSPPTVYKEGKI